MKLVLQITLGILLVPVAILLLFFLGGVVIGATRDSSDALEAITASFDDTGIKATVNADKLVLQATQYGTRANADRNPRATCAEFASRLLAEHPVDVPVARLTTIRMYHGYTTGNLQWVDCPIWP